MNKEIRDAVNQAVNDYLEATEAWDDAVIAFDPESGKVELMEEEDSEKLPDSYDVYDIMDFIHMTPEGKWLPDSDAIASLE